MSSVLPLSFSWGFNPKLETEENIKKENQPTPKAQENKTLESNFSSSNLRSSTTNTSFNSAKRRYQDESDPSLNNNNNYTTTISTSRRQANNYEVRKPIKTHKSFSSVKRSRSVYRIQGQQLPPTRLIESLDHQSLQTLLNNIINIHPEITDSLYKCSPRPTVSACIDILQTKVDLVLSQLPYKVDVGSEYAYLRVKPYIDDFLHALSDYTLNFLAPVETTPANSLDFLDQATTLLHKLPTFNKASNNYFSDIAYEQLGHTWMDSLKEFIKSADEDGSGIYVLINQGWEARLRGHSEGSKQRLANISEWFNNKVRELQDSPAKRFNFSLGNSPIVRGFQGNGDLLQGHSFR